MDVGPTDSDPRLWLFPESFIQAMITDRKWCVDNANGLIGESDYVLYNRIRQTQKGSFFAAHNGYDALSSEERSKILTAHLAIFAYNFALYWEDRITNGVSDRSYLYPRIQWGAYDGAKETGQFEDSEFDVVTGAVFRPAHTGHLNRVRLDAKCTAPRRAKHAIVPAWATPLWTVKRLPEMDPDMSWEWAPFPDDDAIKTEEGFSSYYSRVGVRVHRRVMVFALLNMLPTDDLEEVDFGT